MKMQSRFIIFFTLLSIAAHAQMKIGNNPTSINSASLLELETTNKGLVFPRLSLTDVSSSSPLPSGLLTGTVVFNTNAGIINGNSVGLYLWNGSSWTAITPNTSSTAWSLTGNSGTGYSTNFIGTTDNAGFRIRTNNTERLLIDSLGDIGIGSSAFNTFNREKLLIDYGATTSHTLASLRGSIDNYLQVNFQNQSNGINASTDYVATADDGTDSTYYIDMGINSSTYARSAHNWGSAHDSYLYSNSKNLLIGTATSNDIVFMVNGGAISSNTVMRLKGSNGNVVVGKGDNTLNPTGNTIRGPNANGTDISGGSLTLYGGSATGTAAGGSVYINGGSTSSGSMGSVNINVDNNSASNLNTGTSTGSVTIGNSLNNINLPKLSTSSVVLTDASKNLTSTIPSANTYLYYNGTNFTWAAATTLASFSATAPLTYNNTTGVFAINQATALADGYLSTTDWNTFNNKIGSITLNPLSSVFSTPINFSVSSGTATGTLSLATQTANTVFAGPASGVAAAPAFRTLIASDIPSLAGSYIQNQSTLQASSNFNISGNGTIGGLLTSSGGHTNTGAFTTSGGAANINASSNNATNINTGTSTSNITIGNSSNNILLPKFNTAGGIIYTAASTGQIAGTASNMTWDDVNNRLGIGYTTPSTALHVNGIVSIGKSTATTGGLNFYNSTNANTITINSGTTSSSYSLTLPAAGATANGQALVSTTGGTLSWTSVGVSSAWQLTGNSGTTAGTNFIGTTDGIDFVAKTNNTERMRVMGALNGSSQAGWVGMGISLPRSLLDVTGSFTNKNVITIQNTSSTGYSSVDMMDNSGTLKGTFGYANSTASGIFAGKDYFNIYGNDFVFTGNSNNNDFFIKGTTGYTGLNTNAPSERLHVVGNIYLNGAFMPAGDAGTSGYVLTSAGVATSPTWAKATSFAWGIAGNAGTNSSTDFIGTTDAQPLVFRTNNTEEMRLTSGGALLINTTTASGSEVLNASGSFKLGTSGTVLTNIIKGSGSLPAFTVAGIGTTVTKTITVTGANTNASVIVNPRSSLPGGLAIAYSYVSLANTVSISFVSTLASISVAAITLDITIIQ